MTGDRPLRRGIYLLPTLFTVGNMFCGYASIVQASRGFVELAALLLIVAGILDGLDGRIARLTKSTSAFGLEFDSLADIVSFGVAPALLAYHWALRPLGRIGWLIGFIFLVCAAMRLARFNIQTKPAERRHFAGLPSPMAAGALATLVFAFPEVAEDSWLSVGLAVFVASLAMLMISRLRYRSFKEVDVGGHRSYTYVLPLAAIFVSVALWPRSALLTISLAYLLSAPLGYVWSLMRRAGRKPAAATVNSGGDSEVVDGPALR